MYWLIVLLVYIYGVKEVNINKYIYVILIILIFKIFKVRMIVVEEIIENYRNNRKWYCY